MKKIGLDAGHGLKTPGKQTPDGIKEWTLNDKVRDKVVRMLADYDVEIINVDNDEGVVDETLADRWNRYMNAGVDAFVSIHHNAYTGYFTNVTGLEVYTDKKPTTADLKLADCVYTRMVKYIGLRGRGVKRLNFAVINQNKIPAILCEGGFMDSNIDYKVITSDAGQEAYARAVAEGLIEFCNLKKKDSKPTPAPETKDDFLPARGWFQKGDRGPNVEKINDFFYRVFPGYASALGRNAKNLPGPLFGVNTKAWVEEFQRRTGLEDDGCIGPITLAEMEKYGFKK